MSEESFLKIPIVAKPPQDFFDARAEAFGLAGWKCVVKKDSCLDEAIVAHQKKLIIGDAASGYERKIPNQLQVASNLVVCCTKCHSWIHNNQEEATQLGYLDR